MMHTMAMERIMAERVRAHSPPTRHPSPTITGKPPTASQPCMHADLCFCRIDDGTEHVCVARP
eukprot:10947-Eustigmatos_ZCMA.PRE.1